MVGVVWQEARFPLFLIIPLGVFIVDRLMGVKQNVQELTVIESELLPSGIGNPLASCHLIQILIKPVGKVC